MNDSKQVPVQDGERPGTAQFLRHIFRPDDVVYVFVKSRDLSKNPHYSGCYELGSSEKLVQDVMQHDRQAVGIYYSLNPVSKDCLSKANNCLVPASTGKSIASSDVVRRRLLLVDIDPKREADLSATREEKESAANLAESVLSDLQARDWPKPVIVDSGNGYHLLFRIDLPVQDDNLVRHCLIALAQKHDQANVKIDRLVFDPIRIAKLPGTMACKGQPTTDRPHRQATCLKLPEPFEVVSKELLLKLAAEVEPKPTQGLPLIQRRAVKWNRAIVANARKYLQAMPPAISGEHGQSQFLNAACRLVDDFALPEQPARELLAEYNSRCEPPFDSQELDRKLKSAMAKVQERGGPSGCAINQKPKAPQSKIRRFCVYVPDFGFALVGSVLSDVSIEPARHIWLRNWLLWNRLQVPLVVPDILLRQWFWGANHGRNWKTVLSKKLKLKGPRQKTHQCDSGCILHEADIRHEHYLLFKRDSNCGFLEKFSEKPGQAAGPRRFMFFAAEHEKVRTNLIKSGSVFNVYWPALVLGSSPKVGWTWPQQRLVVGLVRELTRTKARPGELVSGEIIKNSQVAVSGAGYRNCHCPLLDRRSEYVVFAGNGKRKGKGYQLIGRTGKGWLFRAGYLKLPTMQKEQQIADLPTFLANLALLTKQLDLIPTGVFKGVWKSLDEMLDDLKTSKGRRWLCDCTMQVFAPADWRVRWRRFFSDKLGFLWIPETRDDTGAHGELVESRAEYVFKSGTQIKQWLRSNKWTQQRLADEIEAVTGYRYCRRTIGRNLNGQTTGGSFFETVNQTIAKAPIDATS